MLNRLLAVLTALSALLGIAPFIRPRTRAGEAILWLSKLLGGALSPIAGLIGALAALIGLVRRDWRLAGAGLPPTCPTWIRIWAGRHGSR